MKLICFRSLTVRKTIGIRELTAVIDEAFLKGRVSGHKDIARMEKPKPVLPCTKEARSATRIKKKICQNCSIRIPAL